MAIQQIVVLIINIIGGIAVIGSYIYGFNAQSGGANVLWGGVPSSVRMVISISLIIATFAYLAFLYFILFQLTPSEVKIAGRFNYSLFYAIFIGILLPSAFWMPLTNLYATNMSTGVWIAIRAVLILVGLSAIALAWALLSLQTREPAVAYWAAVAGSVYFAFHAGVLDAIIWAAFFRST